MPPPLPVPLDDLNHVIAHDNYIEVVWDGPQDVNTVSKTNAEAVKAAELLKSKGKPILLSLDVQNHPLTPNMGAFKEVIKIFRVVSFDRIAVSGSIAPTIMTLVSTVTSSFNREFEISYFVNQKEAVSWLLS